IKTAQGLVGAALTLSASSGAAIATTAAAIFGGVVSGDVLRAGGGIATITSVIAPNIANINWIQPMTATVPNSAGTPILIRAGRWSVDHPKTVFAGLDYLNGQTVQILADGAVQPPQVVVNGTITLQNAATKVVAGLGYQKQVKTMPLDLGNERDTIQGKRKKVNAVTLRVSDTRGLTFGNTFDNLFPIKEMNPNVQLGSQIPLVTNDERVIWDPAWNVFGQLCFQSNDPLPATILGVIPEITIGDTPGRP